MAKGFSQNYGVDFEETLAPFSRQETIRLVLSLIAYKIWTIHHMDVKSTFLNGYLNEEVYVEKPQGFVVKWKEYQVCKLKKVLYRLK